MQACPDRLTSLGVLALLREGAMHPYEMIQLMRQRHDGQLGSDLPQPT